MTQAAETTVCSPVTDSVLNIRSYAPFSQFGGGFEGDKRAFQVKVAAIAAGTMGVVAALIAAYGDWVFGLFLVVPAALLIVALFARWWRVQVAAQLVLIIELMILGGMWPSPATLAALVALPSLVLGLVYLVKGRAPRWGEVYLLASTLLASAFMLSQALLVANAQH